MWWRCFLIDGRMRGLLMAGEGLRDRGNCVVFFVFRVFLCACIDVI